MRSRTSVLCYGHDTRLLETRGWVLAQAGFEVTNAFELHAVKEALANQPFDLLLLCHTLQPDESRAALDYLTLRALRTKRLLLAPAACDSFLPYSYINKGPAALIATVQHLTGH